MTARPPDRAQGPAAEQAAEQTRLAVLNLRRAWWLRAGGWHELAAARVQAALEHIARAASLRMEGAARG